MVRIMRPMSVLLALLLAGAACGADLGAPVSLEIKSRSVAFDGASFKDHGVYERIVAIAHFQIDPAAKENRAIVDLEHAPRDARGLVKYDVDVVIVRPRDAAQARRVLIYDVVNRGNKTISMLNGGQAFKIAGEADAGDGFLMRQGYTVVWSGWQGDVLDPSLVGARFPVATSNGQPITGRIAIDTIFDNPGTSRINLPYLAATQDPVQARLTVRERTADPERVIASGQWRYEDDGHISVVRPADMDAGAIYRFSYVARDPKVMGLGFAATRDLIAFLRHGDVAGGNPLADIVAAPCERDAAGHCAQAGGVFDTTVAFGVSQSARYLRDMLWQGFNRDLSGRRVFDGMIAMVPGGRRTYTNMRFSEPGRFSRQHEDHDVPGFDFPFTYATLRDPATGRTDGILRNCSVDATCPKLFHVDTSAEFWQAGASLVGTGGTDRDIALPTDVRAYMIAGGSHAPGMTAPMCAYPANTLSYTPVMRALLSDMVDWTSGRSDPPQSRWPKLASGELRSVASLQTPNLSAIGIVWPTVLNQPIAPVGTRGWPVWVPAVDADGNDLAGIHVPQYAAPTGTYVGWNLRKSGYAQGELCLIFGSFIPFASDAQSRGADPRRSLAERYPTPGAAAERSNSAAAALRKERLLPAEDD